MPARKRSGQPATLRQRNTPIFDIATLAERLYQLRHRHHWTQQDLGAVAGVHYVTISKLEKQGLPGVSADTVARLAGTFGVSMDYLLGLTDTEGTQSTAPQVEVAKVAKPRPRKATQTLVP